MRPRAVFATTLAAPIRVLTADGESAEQLGLRLATEHGVLPGQQAVLRCSLHGSQRSLEKCVTSCVQCNKLLDEFVLKTSGASRSDLGAFARAVRNSARLKSWLDDAIAASIDDLARDVGSMAPPVTRSSARVMPSSASQRFDSMLVCLQRFIWNCTASLRRWRPPTTPPHHGHQTYLDS